MHLIDRAGRERLLRILALLLVVGLTAALLSLHDKIQALGAWGYPGIFLVSLLTNATLILPVPGVLITSALGAVYHPLGVALAASSGAALGELTGYLAGYSGQGMAQRVSRYEQIVGWMKKYGDVTILALAFIPNPAFDAAGIVAGVLKMPLHRFLLWCWLGKLLKMLAFAYGGAALARWFA